MEDRSELDNIDPSLTVSRNSEADTIDNGRLSINYDKPVAGLAHEPFAVYYEVDSQFANNKEYIAAILSNRVPCRMLEIKSLLGEGGVNFVAPELIEISSISKLKEQRLVVVSLKPKGVAIAEYINEHGPFSETKIANDILPQILKALYTLESLGVVHGSINPNTIYYDEDTGIVSLDHCLTYPCGYFQPTIYEPFERMIASPIGKDKDNHAADYYALGVTLLYMLTGGKLSTDNLSQNEIIDARFEKSTDDILLGNLPLSGRMRLLLRGLMRDKKLDRWQASKIADWLRGKKINLPIVTLYPNAKRPYRVKECDVFNSGMLAHQFHKDWDSASNYLREPSLIRWIEHMLGNESMAEKINYNLKSLNYTRGSANVTETEFVSKCLVALDHEMPLRIHNFAFCPSSVNMALAHSLSTPERSYLQAVQQAISCGLVSFSVEMMDDHHRNHHTPLANEYDKVRKILGKHELGFGIERCLYELNPWLPCQSPIFLADHITSINEMILRLEELAAEGREVSLLDSHIAGFIACKVGLQREISIKSIKPYKEFAESAAIKAIAFYATIQEATRNLKLPNLAKYLASEAEAVINLFRCKTIKESLRQKVKHAASMGSLQHLLKAITNVRDIQADRAGFRVAVQHYYQLDNLVNQCQDQKKMFEIGYNYGTRFAVIIAYILLGVVILILMAGSFDLQ